MSQLRRAPVPSRPRAPEHIGGAQSGRPDGKDGSSVLEARSERGRVPGRSSRSAGLPTRSVAAQLQVHRSAGHATVGGTRERVRSGACPRGVAGAGRGVAPGRLGRVELAFEASGRLTSPTEAWGRRRKSGRLPTPGVPGGKLEIEWTRRTLVDVLTRHTSSHTPHDLTCALPRRSDDPPSRDRWPLGHPGGHRRAEGPRIEVGRSGC